MLTNINPKLAMRDKAATRHFYIDKIGLKESGNVDYDGYLMLEKDNIQIDFIAIGTVMPEEIIGHSFFLTTYVPPFIAT